MDFTTPEPKEEFTTARIRAICREGFQAAAPRVIAIALGQTEDSSSALSIRALETLGKYGLGPRPDIYLDKAEWLEHIINVTATHITNQEAYEAWLNAIITKINEV